MSDHFADTAKAVLGQSYGDFEWLIESDGTGPGLDDVHGDLSWVWGDPRVRHEATGIAGGAGVARTSALARALGKYIWVMDIDDVPEVGALGELVAAIEAGGAGWAQGVAVDLTPAGLIEHRLPPGFAGEVSPGAMRRYWGESGGLAVHTVGMLIRNEVLAEVGGWYGLAVGEDTGMVLAISDSVRGAVVQSRTLQYRKWEAQTTATAWCAATRALSRQVIERRGNKATGRMDRIGVCSVVRGCDLVHLDELHDNLAGQPMPWHWYLAAGPALYQAVDAWARADSRISVVETAPVGTRALAKNLALGAAEEEVVLCADPFDACTEPALGELYEAVAAGAAYAIPRAVDLGGDMAEGAGRDIGPGELTGAWYGDPEHWPVLSTWLATTASRLWRVGGHPAVSISEDAYLAALLGRSGAGVLLDGTGVIHRPELAPHASALVGLARARVRRVDTMMFARACSDDQKAQFYDGSPTKTTA